MIGIFKERNTFQVILLFIIAVVAKLAYILNPPVITYFPHQGLLTDELNNWYAKGGSIGLSALVAFFINFSSALYANAVLMNQRMFSKMNLLIALSMVLMSSLIPEANILSAPIILLPLLIWNYQNISALYHSTSSKIKLFNAGLGIGVGALLYHPFIIMLAAAMFALASMRTFKLQEWLILLLGLLTPYYFFFAYQFLVGSWHPLQYLPTFTFGYKHINGNTYNDFLSRIVILGWVAIGLFYWQSNLRRMLIQIRKNWHIILFIAVLSTFVIFIKTGGESDAFALAVFPLASIATSAFLYPQKKFFPVLLFWIIVFMNISNAMKGLKNERIKELKNEKMKE